MSVESNLSRTPQLSLYDFLVSMAFVHLMPSVGWRERRPVGGSRQVSTLKDWPSFPCLFSLSSTFMLLLILFA